MTWWGHRRVFVVWSVLAALLAATVAVQYRDVVASRALVTAADDRRLVTVPMREVGALEIAQAGVLHRFQRDANGAWFYHGSHGASSDGHAHDTDPALAERIERAFDAFSRARIEREITRGPDLATYGLLAPTMLILVYRGSDRQPTLQYAVGDIAPDTVSRYVDVVGGAGIVTIPGYQVDNLTAVLKAATAAQE